MGNPVLNPKNYARITGIALAAVAILGIVLSAIGTDGQYGLFCSDAATCEGAAAEESFLGFDWTHNIVHVVLAAVALIVGFMAMPFNYVRLYAWVFGAVYLVLGIVGFIIPDLGILTLELGENLVHLVIGAYGLAAAMWGVPAMTATPAPTAPRRV